MVIEEVFGGQHRVDDSKRAGQVRVTQRNSRGRKRRSSCADREVRSDLLVKKRNTL